ncbi:MAG: glycosyltransferase family 2 protein [Deltaproteobacteria bacterium]|nr:glycosyltransferase family 2 protein [Deltaproteobacteria bacterium]
MTSCAICVTYNPDIGLLKKGITSSLTQLDKIYVVDNGSDCNLIDPLSAFGVDQVEFIALPSNVGIAAALNVGIKRARSAGFEFTLLLDQDSVPPGRMIDRYLTVFKILDDDGQRVAALGPRYRNPQTGHCSQFVRFNWFRNSYHGGNVDSAVLPTDFLISSGSFYALSVFDDVGLFDENLFIDHVDTEWCHRAKSRGFQCFGVSDVVMQHSLGEGGVRLWFLRWRIHPMHKPFRLYFITRNSLLMYRMQHVPLKWISGDVLRLVRLFFVYLIFSSNKKASIGWMLKGLKDGIKRVTGAECVFGVGTAGDG